MITKHMFQFHNGTINTLLLSDCIIILFGFNSTTVQLIHGVLPAYDIRTDRVSIPQRYN